MTRALSLGAAIGASAIAAAVLAAPAPAGGCPGAGRTLASASPHTLRAALLCVVNRRRAEHGVRALRPDRRIRRAARRHARDMARRGYFAHQRAGGPDLTARLRRASWRGSAWGEAIAYGCGAAGSPRAIVRSWMRSPPHRAILLSGRYRRAGVGLGRAAPCGRGGASWVLDVGRR